MSSRVGPGPGPFAKLLNEFVSQRSYFLLASLNYLMNLFPRRSYFLLASSNPRIQESKKRKIQESIGENARPQNQALGRFRNLQMLYLDFYTMSIFSRKDFLYNKALATTLEGSQKILGGTYSRSSCDETGSATEIWGYVGKIWKGGNL